MSALITFGSIIIFIFVLSGFRVLRPIEKGLIERFGKYTRTVESGLHWIIPFVDRLIRVNVTEQMVDIQPQTVITSDKLNAVVDAVVYYKILDIKKAAYNVDDHEEQLTSLARTTLRAVIGKMTLTEANENRDDINAKVETVLDRETDSYGVEVLRVEIQAIDPPEDVQISMNQVVKAEQEKIAARDLANAIETKADGDRRAEIQKAEGVKRGLVLKAEGEAEAILTVADARAREIALINDAINKHFKGEAKFYKQLETTERSMENNAKYVIDSKSNLVNVISDAAGVPLVPIDKKKK